MMRNFVSELTTLKSSITSIIDKTCQLPHGDVRVERYKSRIDEFSEILKKLLSDDQSDNHQFYLNVTFAIEHLGLLSYNIQDYQRAAQYLQHALARYQSFKTDDHHMYDQNVRLMILICFNLSDCYMRLNHVDMARNMLYEALVLHHRIVNQDEMEKRFCSGNPNDSQFIQEFKLFYDRKTSSAVQDKPFFNFSSDILMKKWNTTDAICDQISQLSVNGNIASFSPRTITQLDYLKTVLDYQNTIRVYSATITDLKKTDVLLGYFLSGIQALNQITNKEALDFEQQKKFDDAFLELHTELGNLYFRLGQLEKGREHWKTVIRSFSRGMPTPAFFASSALVALHTNLAEGTLYNMLEHCGTVCQKSGVNNYQIADDALYTHEALQIHQLLPLRCDRANTSTYKNASWFIHGIGTDYENMKQFKHAIDMYNAAITMYRTENQLDVLKNLNDNRRRWLIATYLDLFDCYKGESIQDGMVFSYQNAMNLFKDIANKTTQEVSLKTPEAIIDFYKKETARWSFYKEPAYRNALSVVQSIQKEESVEALIRQMTSIDLDEASLIAPIHAVNDDRQIRSLAMAYLFLANEMSGSQNGSQSMQSKYRIALQSAMTIMEKLKSPTVEDQHFLSAIQEQYAMIERPCTQSVPKSINPTSSWQPTFFPPAQASVQTSAYETTCVDAMQTDTEPSRFF